MARISEKDAIRLGLVPAVSPTVSKAPALRSGRTPIPGRSTPRRKGGRLPSESSAAPFSLTFEVPFEAKTKHRPRSQMPRQQILKAFVQARGNLQAFQAMLDGLNLHTYTKDETKAYEEAVTSVARAAMRGKPAHEGPVDVELIFHMEGSVDLLPTDVTDPDIDNVEKALLDACNKVVWKDDRLVCSKRAVKLCSPRPHVEVRVRSFHPVGDRSIETITAIPAFA